MGRYRWVLVLMVVCLVVALMPGAAMAGKGGGGPKAPGPNGGGGGESPLYLTSLCDGPRSPTNATGGEYQMPDQTWAPADLACDEAHGVTEASFDGSTSHAPTLFSDCAGNGSWRPGNSHPCPYGSVGLSGVSSPNTGWVTGWDEDTAAGTVFGYQSSVIRFLQAAGGVVVATIDGELVATHVRLYLRTFPDGDQFTNDPNDLQLNCPLTPGASVTLQVRADDIPIYPGKGDRIDKRNGPVASMSVGDIVLVPADTASAPHETIDVSVCGSG